MEQNQALLKRLADFRLDDPESSFPFSAKLAKEQGWSPTFTTRAIEEYKRFCYLAVVAGHPVSPSEVVDEVWHLHLTYSANYWKVFCPEVLQMPFHHHPSKGGMEERAKFNEWVLLTHDSYTNAFGEEPPADIWNSPKPKQTEPDTHYRVSKALIKNVAQGLAFATGLLVLAGCTEAFGGNPLDMRGPDFLQFYIVLFLVLFGVGLGIRSLLRLPSELGSSIPGDLDPYSVAYLNGKSVLAVNAAITSLLTQQVIELDVRKLSLRTVQFDYVPTHELEREILSFTGSAGGIRIPTLRNRCQAVISRIHDQMESQGFVLSSKQRTISSLSSFVVAMAAPAYGLMKIQVGISRERPVLFLEILCVLSVVICLFLLITPFRSRRGDKMLASIRQSRSHLRTVGRHVGQANSHDIALGMALFGVAALSGSAYAAQARRLAPQPGASSCGGGSSCSSSSSSCSGGSGGG
ncbi:MAG: TIGR04222 domain-containing membrane protein, partial [Armatimonadota bacterium]